MKWIERKYLHFYHIMKDRNVRIFGVLMCLLAGLIAWKGQLYVGLGILGAEVLGQAFLPWLRFQYAVLSLLTYPIGRVVGFVALSLVYVLVITPIGLFRKRGFPGGWKEMGGEINPEKMFE